MASEQQGERELGVNEYFAAVKPDGRIEAESTCKSDNWVGGYFPDDRVAVVTLIESSQLAAMRAFLQKKIDELEEKQANGFDDQWQGFQEQIAEYRAALSLLGEAGR